ncbi:MAG: hypothetical protein KA054_00570 [Candidatus Moranbacteria bacterium]|nr:hypothetical protein [Candidatus Moranbacteria bacterium]
MKETKERQSHDFRENIRTISEIQATRGRGAEHFIKIFRHEGDNVASATLGTLLGVFEIDDSSEDSRYIVNFLFSVARNEYFCNPRRGAVESFEAALHKINVALAEIVKHGNIRWLGKFHGTIAILEKNAIHLSAAGDGRIYLSRSHSFSHISEGLASTDAVDRPIKTFIEISSGQLLPGDRILFLLPKAVEIIGESILAHHAEQMDRDRLNQFLRTAMINKLDRGGAIVIDIEEALPPLKPRPEMHKKTSEKRPHSQNYFSETAFEKQHRESVATALSEEKAVPSYDPEYTDVKTGHIYVQGNQKETAIESSRIAQYIESFLYYSQMARKEGWLKSAQLFRTLSSKAKFFLLSTIDRARETHALLTTSSSRYLQRKLSRETNTQTQSSTAEITVRNTSFSQFSDHHRKTEGLQPETRFSARVSPWISSLKTTYQPHFASFIRSIRMHLHLISEKIQRVASFSTVHFQMLFSRLSLKGRLVLAFTCLGILAILLWRLLPTETSHIATEVAPSISDQETLLPNTIQNQELMATNLPLVQTILQHPDTIASTYIGNTPVVVTRKTVEIPSKQSSLPLPDGIGVPKMLAPMQDLDLLFFLTDTGTLMTMSPINGALTPNTLPENTSSIAQMGVYLTYLYTLSTDGAALFRFPRVQGGFGDGTPWLKQNLSPDQNASFALNENVFIFSQATLARYSRGKADLTFDAPSVAPDRLILATEAENTLLVGLDSQNGRLIVWNTTDGHIKTQYFSDALRGATSLALHDRTILISTQTETFESILPLP